MARASKHPLAGRWRITEMELWDADFLDLVQPAFISFDGEGSGEFAFGAVQAGLDCWYGVQSADFTWEGFDEMDLVRGDGEVELEDDGTLTGEIRYHLGDESTFKARRW
jgi:hypothetical protein